MKFLAVFTLLILIASPHTKQHLTPSDFWGAVRMKPVTIMAVEGDTVYWSFQDTNEIKLGSVTTDQYTKYPPNFSERETYILVFCEVHKYAYEFVTIPPR
jgi:hypothetical protein